MGSDEQLAYAVNLSQKQDIIKNNLGNLKNVDNKNIDKKTENGKIKKKVDNVRKQNGDSLNINFDDIENEMEKYYYEEEAKEY